MNSEKNRFLLSIVLVTYNAEKWIFDCLRSIVENAGNDCQLVIIDGKSTDGTLGVTEKFSDYIDVLVSEDDFGIYDAMNKSIKYLKGEWVMFLGADDRLLKTFPSFISRLKNKQTIYYGNCLSNKENLGGEFSKYKLSKRNLCHQAIAYPIDVFKKYRYDTTCKVFADYLINIQCWGDNVFSKEYVPIDVSFYSMEGFSSYTKDEAFKAAKPFFIKRYLGWIIFLRYSFRKLKERGRKDSDFF